MRFIVNCVANCKDFKIVYENSHLWAVHSTPSGPFIKHVTLQGRGGGVSALALRMYHRGGGRRGFRTALRSDRDAIIFSLQNPWLSPEFFGFYLILKFSNFLTFISDLFGIPSIHLSAIRLLRYQTLQSAPHVLFKIIHVFNLTSVLST